MSWKKLLAVDSNDKRLAVYAPNHYVKPSRKNIYVWVYKSNRCRPIICMHKLIMEIENWRLLLVRSLSKIPLLPESATFQFKSTSTTCVYIWLEVLKKEKYVRHYRILIFYVSKWNFCVILMVKFLCKMMCNMV